MVTILSACKQSGEKATRDMKADTSISEEELKSDIKDMVYPLPSPLELSQKLEDIGASYVGDILNPISNIENYFTEKNKALNLGVYSADLSYVTTYHKDTEIHMYSDVVRKLIEQLDIEIDYSRIINEETQQFVTNDKDSLVNIVTDIFYDTYEFLNKKGDPEMAALMAAGIWVEGLYIATHISDDTFNNYEIVKIIYEQRNSLNKLIELLDSFENTQMIESINNALKKLKVMYDNTDGSLNKEELDQITGTIETIRASIVS